MYLWPHDKTCHCHRHQYTCNKKHAKKKLTSNRHINIALAALDWFELCRVDFTDHIILHTYDFVIERRAATSHLKTTNECLKKPTFFEQKIYWRCDVSSVMQFVRFFKSYFCGFFCLNWITFTLATVYTRSFIIDLNGLFWASQPVIYSITSTGIWLHTKMRCVLIHSNNLV